MKRSKWELQSRLERMRKKDDGYFRKRSYKMTLIELDLIELERSGEKDLAIYNKLKQNLRKLAQKSGAFRSGACR